MIRAGNHKVGEKRLNLLQNCLSRIRFSSHITEPATYKIPHNKSEKLLAIISPREEVSLRNLPSIHR